MLLSNSMEKAPSLCHTQRQLPDTREGSITAKESMDKFNPYSDVLRESKSSKYIMASPKSCISKKSVSQGSIF